MYNNSEGAIVEVCAVSSAELARVVFVTIVANDTGSAQSKIKSSSYVA